MTRHPSTLLAWLYGTPVASVSRIGDGVRLTWREEAARRWGLGARVLSELLPVAAAGSSPHDRRARAFLSGLLAEGNLRDHLAFEAGVPVDDVVGILAAYGRDTAGALVLLGEDAACPDPLGRWEPTTDSEIALRLRAAGRFAPDGLGSTSLAGVQPKIVLRRYDDRWFRCLAGAPSTHILKVGHPADSAIADVIDTEAACIALARSLSLTSVEAVVTTFEDVRALVVSRYDRTLTADGAVDRLHQEDAAQALGLDASDMNRKFQRGRALPSLRAIATVLRNGGAEPDELLRLTTFNLAVGNSDAHAKNISILRPSDGAVSLAPAYDIAMHAHHRTFSDTFAMDVNQKNRMSRLSAQDLLAEGRSWPLPPRRAQRAVVDTLTQLDHELDVIDRSRHPGVSETAWRAVRDRTGELLRSTS